MKVGNDLIRHGAIVLVGMLGANVLGYVFHFAMSRQLGVAGYGSMVGLVSLVTLSSIPAMVAQTIVAKRISGFVEPHRTDRIRRFVRSVLPCVAAIALAACATVFAARSGIAAFLHASDTLGVTLVAWAVAFYLTLPVLNGILQGDQRFHGLAVSFVSDAITRATLAIILVGRGYGVTGALVAVALGATCATALSAWFVSDLLRAPERHLEPSAGDLTFAASLRVSGGLLAISILASIDVLLVNHYRTAYEAGLFGSLALIGRIVYLISGFVPTIVLPKAAASVTNGNSPIPLLLQAAIVFLIALSTILIPLLAAPALILRIVAGNAYLSAAPLLALYGSAIAFLAAAYAAANYNVGVNRFNFVIPVMLIGCAEVGVIAVRHESLTTIVAILALGHLLIFLATVFRIWEYRGNDETSLVTGGLIQSEM